MWDGELENKNGGSRTIHNAAKPVDRPAYFTNLFLLAVTIMKMLIPLRFVKQHGGDHHGNVDIPFVFKPTWRQPSWKC